MLSIIYTWFPDPLMNSVDKLSTFKCQLPPTTHATYGPPLAGSFALRLETYTNLASATSTSLQSFYQFNRSFWCHVCCLFFFNSRMQVEGFASHFVCFWVFIFGVEQAFCHVRTARFFCLMSHAAFSDPPAHSSGTSIQLAAFPIFYGGVTLWVRFFVEGSHHTCVFAATLARAGLSLSSSIPNWLQF